MTQPVSKLADEIMRLVEINRTTINALNYGDVVFRIHQGRLVEVIASNALKLSAGTQLYPLVLKAESNH
ncbi:hypothetical protein ANRL1_03862 [Anaerolineae bacterium]|nr:hypothetical protein ANRL1_03862 [Anaerolineae bacterium]